MLTNKTKKGIRVCGITALILCLLWAVFEVFHFMGLLAGWGGVSEKVEWSENKTIKIIFFIAYLISAVALIGLCVKVVFNTLRGMRENNAFPQNNVKPLLWLAVVSFFYMLCWMNQSVLHGMDGIHLQGVNFILPFLLLFFAFMYKVAADAVEENNLTI